MCGIAGILRRDVEYDPGGTVPGYQQVVSAMLLALARRGPDGQGMVECGRLTLGHRRLAIIDRHERSNQPLTGHDGRFIISFNGEIYNHTDLRKEMALRPSDLRTRSDTEVLLRAWQLWGRDCLDRLVGPFAFALWDKQQDELWLVRDRFGEKPLFYHEGDEAWSFASSIGALLEVPWIAPELDAEATREYLSLRYCVAPRTVIRGVKKLRRGEALRIRRNFVESILWNHQSFGRERIRSSREDLVAEFDFLLRQASRRCLVGDVPKAVFLSDGIDSAGIAESVEHSVPAFTFVPKGSGEPGVDVALGSSQLRVSASDRFAAMVPAFLVA